MVLVSAVFGDMQIVSDEERLVLVGWRGAFGYLRGNRTFLTYVNGGLHSDSLYRHQQCFDITRNDGPSSRALWWPSQTFDGVFVRRRASKYSFDLAAGACFLKSEGPRPAWFERKDLASVSA